MDRRYIISTFTFLLLVFSTGPAKADVKVQCPGDNDGDARWATAGVDDPQPANTQCIHLAAGDGYVSMGDGYPQYIFSFSDVTGVLPEMVMDAGMLAANFAAPTMKMKEGDKVYLTLTNVGMIVRPDLFDPHSVHFHGFVNASPVFDGEPMSGIAVNMGASLTYYYEPLDPGTYMYHCHVEASEHMQMGMLGNLYVTPAQDGQNIGGCGSQTYAYNDGDGSTCYDVDYPIQLEGFDPIFHDLHLGVQPLPFANMKDTYPMINGRGYPDTVNPNPLPAPVIDGQTGKVSQQVSSLITATAGQKVLLRISSLATVDFYTLRLLGIPMKIVGRDAKILRSTTGADMSYTASSLTLGGGESVDVILDTAGVTPGTYFLYTTNLNHLSNNYEDYGGMMTEIVIN